MLVTIYMMNEAHPPKRGDLLQSNIGDRRERTWIILRVTQRYPRRCKKMGGVVAIPYKVWAERWWSLESETRMALYRSAERAGGQRVVEFKRFPSKRKTTFDDYIMRRS